MREINPEFNFCGELQESLKLCLELIYKENSGPTSWVVVDGVLHLFEYAPPKDASSFPTTMTTEMLFPMLVNWLKQKVPTNPIYGGDGSNVVGFKISVVDTNLIRCLTIKPWNIYYSK